MMQEYDDDFFFEEDKIKTPAAVSNVENNKSQPLVVEDNAATSTVATQDSAITDIEINDPFEDKIIVEEIVENTDCVFNDMRRDRYLIRHQNLM